MHEQYAKDAKYVWQESLIHMYTEVNHIRQVLCTQHASGAQHIREKLHTQYAVKHIRQVLCTQYASGAQHIREKLHTQYARGARHVRHVDRTMT